MNQAIKPFQTRGAWGPRHIHRRPFEVVNIPKFSSQDPRHIRLAELSRECHKKVAGLVPELKGKGIGRLRGQVREHLKAELGELDGVVKAILAP